jgi:ABC-type transport system involved in multi-copper enzyme maturation permease subunit
MAVALVNSFPRFINPSWVTGPIFDKELRVSSRRRRNYVLRSAYLAGLVFLVAGAWSIALLGGSGQSVALRVSRMAEVGRSLVLTITWFQFLTAQVLAAVMLSNSISDEIRRGTMDVLMTTPISSFQIVIGKLCSKLLQLILLLAISLPLLAMIRVFGGVSWDYVFSSLCITATTIIFTGSLSLLFSTSFRHAYVTIVMIMVVYIIVFAAPVILLTYLAFKGVINSQIAYSIIYSSNPFAALAMNTYSMLSIPRTGGVFFSWPLHCSVMLCASVVMLSLSILRVRKAALSQAGGIRKKPGSALNLASSKLKTADVKKQFTSTEPITRIRGPAIIWKDMHKPLYKRNKAKVLFCGLAIIIIALMLLLLMIPSPVHSILLGYLLSILSVIVMIRLAVLSATSIAAEKESRTWPILLTTPLDDKQILWGKGIAVFRRNIPLLLLWLVLYCLCYARIAVKNPMIILYAILVPIRLTSSVLLVIGMGLYFSARLKSTTAAVASTVGVYIALTYFCCCSFSPLSSMFYMMEESQLSRNDNIEMWFVFLISTAIPASIYAGTGLLLLWRAKCRLRLDIF